VRVIEEEAAAPGAEPAEGEPEIIGKKPEEGAEGAAAAEGAEKK
jgi:hypothetical protein